jgi:hypothetical protein
VITPVLPTEDATAETRVDAWIAANLYAMAQRGDLWVMPSKRRTAI